MKKRLDWIDILKGFAIIMVVYGHIIKNEEIIKFIYMIHLPIFMFISGFLFKEDGIKNNFKKKTLGILVPYLFFAMINFIYFFTVEKKFREINLTPLQGIIGIIGGYYDYLTFNVHLWYLPFFFSAVILYNFIAKTTNIKVSRFIYITLGIIYLFIDIPNLPMSINRFDLLLFFAIGELIANLKVKGKLNFYELNNCKKILILLICLICIACIYNFKIDFYGINYIIGCLGIIVMSSISMIIEKKDIILKEIGKKTIIILAIHGPIYRILIKITSMFFKSSTDFIRDNFFLCTLIVICTISICYVCYICLRKICPMLIGEKSKI